MIPLDLTGQTFTRLKTVSVTRHPKTGVRAWLCICDCGNTAVVATNQLRYGAVKSCGCLQPEVAGARFRTHGKTGSKLHWVWKAMISRCHNERNPAFHRYGGRGIKVCQRWRESFAAFEADVGEAPFPGASLDRVNNDGDYEPDNVRWATRSQQGMNRRNNHLLEIRGVKKTLQEWAAENGLDRRVIAHRLKSGWPVEAAVSEPSSNHKRFYGRARVRAACR